METRRVNRPVFRLSKPGEDVRWTTRKTSPQRLAITQRKQELAQELPQEQIREALKKEAGAAVTPAEMEQFRASVPSLPKSSPYHPVSLQGLNEAELDELLRNAATDSEIESVDEEFNRRGYKSFPPE